jgi:hypothetical protein
VAAVGVHSTQPVLDLRMVGRERSQLQKLDSEAAKVARCMQPNHFTQPYRMSGLQTSQAMAQIGVRRRAGQVLGRRS